VGSDQARWVAFYNDFEIAAAPFDLLRQGGSLFPLPSKSPVSAMVQAD